MSGRMFRAINGSLLFLVFLLPIFSVRESFAIPAFSRLYGTSCSTCHIDFPKLNDFGKAFKDAGFKFPKDDESMLKIPPVMLGAPANAELWPKAIWPGTIPGIPPIGLRYNNYFQFTGSSRNKFNNLLPPGTVGPYVPTTDFETGLFSIFTAGNFGSDIAFWVDDDISVSGANANGGLGEAYLKFVNIGRLLKLPRHSLNLARGPGRAGNTVHPGEVHLGQPVRHLHPGQHRRRQPGVQPAVRQQLVHRCRDRAKGSSSAAVGIPAATTTPSPSLTRTPAARRRPQIQQPTFRQATGSNNGGVGVASDANFKDIYASFNYRFNLEKDKESRNAIQAAGPSGPRDHTY